ncbi:MAG: TonB family protein [Pseudomonadota bacterium]
MIKRSATMAAAAFFLSGALHVGGLTFYWPKTVVEMEGGAQGQVARLGDSFRDMAVGTLTPETAEETQENAEPETVQETVEVDAEAERAEVQRTTEVDVAEIAEEMPTPTEILEAEPTQDVKRSPIEPAETVEVDQRQSSLPVEAEAPKETPKATAQVESPAPLTAIQVSQTPTSAEAPMVVAAAPAVRAPTLPPLDTRPLSVEPVAVPPLDTSPPSAQDAALTPVTPRQSEAIPDPTAPPVIAALPDADEAAPQLSKRPVLRPREIVRATPEPPKPSQRGNSQTAERRGSTDGARDAQAQTASANVNARAQQAGNAAVSNYPGMVMRRIQRRKPNTSLRGTATVSFRIAPSGALAALSLSKSSGSARFDQLALSTIRRAAPFPEPPPGAKRAFTIPIRGR